MGRVFHKRFRNTISPYKPCSMLLILVREINTGEITNSRLIQCYMVGPIAMQSHIPVQFPVNMDQVMTISYDTGVIGPKLFRPYNSPSYCTARFSFSVRTKPNLHFNIAYSTLIMSVQHRQCIEHCCMQTAHGISACSTGHFLLH